METPMEKKAPNSTTLAGAHRLTQGSPISRRTITNGSDILSTSPETIDFLHSTFCQVGIPRKPTVERTFERRIGNASVFLEAGALWNGQEWIEQPLPCGTKPRLILVYLTGQALRTNSREIDVGESMNNFMSRLGLSRTGGKRGNYGPVHEQLNALSACTIKLGFTHNNRAITSTASSAIENTMLAFDAGDDGRQRTLWPSTITLREEFFRTLGEHAVPLDPRAIAALQDSALAMDVYTWLAYRLVKITNPKGVTLTWANLREQFGQEYGNSKDFKDAYKIAMARVLNVYPGAKIDSIYGGLRFLPSPSPIKKVSVLLPGNITPPR